MESKRQDNICILSRLIPCSRCEMFACFGVRKDQKLHRKQGIIKRGGEGGDGGEFRHFGEFC